MENFWEVERSRTVDRLTNPSNTSQSSLLESGLFSLADLGSRPSHLTHLYPIMSSRLVEPQVLHFMQVPFLTKVKFPQPPQASPS